MMALTPTDVMAPDAATTTELVDGDSLLDEIGSSYPLLAYVAEEEDERNAMSAIDALILGGLIEP